MRQFFVYVTVLNFVILFMFYNCMVQIYFYFVSFSHLYQFSSWILSLPYQLIYWIFFEFFSSSLCYHCKIEITLMVLGSLFIFFTPCFTNFRVHVLKY